MQKFLVKILGINWKTTLSGISLIIGVVTKILLAWRTKDFATIFSSSQELITDISLLLMGLGLLSAKDASTTGTGDGAVKVSGNIALNTDAAEVPLPPNAK